MKKIGYEMMGRGYDVEFMHCSSDNNSLDGIVIPAIKVALLDGTAPHVVDPKNPGAVDEILHLGDYWNEGGLRVNKADIMKDNKEISSLFTRAYRYIKAANQLYEDTAVINSIAMDFWKVNVIGAKLEAELFDGKDIAVKEGKQRKLFASAITPDGLKNYLESILTTEKTYVVKGDQGTGTEKLLERLKSAAIERGYDVELFYCPLNPSKLEHMVIPDLDVSITTSNNYHASGVNAYESVDLNEYLNPSVLEKYKETLVYNKTEFDALLNQAISTIGKAKALHDHMETYYIPNMDFEAVQLCWESTLARILEYAEEYE